VQPNERASPLNLDAFEYIKLRGSGTDRERFVTVVAESRVGGAVVVVKAASICQPAVASSSRHADRPSVGAHCLDALGVVVYYY
jgi:hypothetical protein